MYTSIVLALGVLTQTAPPPSPSGDGRRGDPGVRIWVSDTLYQVGAGARVYVKLREPGYLVVLHTDAMGRIRVLYPVAPDDQAVVPAAAPFEVTGSDDGATFRVESRGRGTLLAVRSAHPFQFEPLRRANRWDYDESLLLQPTAGNAFAALLDIADRVADGQPYDYDMTAYGTPGTVAQGAGSDTVCFSCLTARHPRSASSEAAGYGNGALAIDHSYAAANNSSVVDCSNANLVDSFCGVQDNSVTNTYTDNSTYESNTVVYPVIEPFFIPFRRFARHTPPTPPPPPPAITLPMRLRPVSRRLLPPPPRRRPPIVVVQPTAPSHPEGWGSRTDPVAAAPVLPAQPARVARPAAVASSGMPRGHAGVINGGGGAMGTAATFAAPVSRAPATTTTMTRSAAAQPRALVPSRAMVRALNAARH